MIDAQYTTGKGVTIGLLPLGTGMQFLSLHADFLLSSETRKFPAHAHMSFMSFSVPLLLVRALLLCRVLTKVWCYRKIDKALVMLRLCV